MLPVKAIRKLGRTILSVGMFYFAASISALAAQQFTLKFSTASGPLDTHTIAIQKFKEAIEKSSNGQIKIEVFHSSALYKQDAEAEALMRGTLEMNYTSANWLADKVPEAGMFASGYLYKDYNHMTKTLNGEVGNALFEKVVKAIGIRPLGALYLGSRQMNYRDIGRQIKTPEDMKGVKLRMPNSPSWLFLGKALGGNPTALNFGEIYLGFKTGTIDAQDNALIAIKNSKFYEVTKYVTLTEHVIDSVWPTINEKVWQQMGPELQRKMYDAIAVARSFNDTTNLEAEKTLVEFCRAQGMIVVQPDKAAFMKAVQQAYLGNKDISGKWDMDLFKKVQALAN